VRALSGGVGGAQDGRRADFDTRESAEFELADARAARGMLQTDFVRGRPGEEADVVRAGPPAEGDAVSIKVMAQTPLGYALLVNRLAPRLTTLAWPRAWPCARRGCTHLLHPPPSAPTPLTRPPLPPWRNSQYDGLVYHSEVFDDPPRVGAVAQAWVSKVRRRAQRCFQTQLLCPSARAGARAAVSSPGCARSGARSGSHRARRVAH
jgi:hypothetical protein